MNVMTAKTNVTSKTNVTEDDTAAAWANFCEEEDGQINATTTIDDSVLPTLLNLIPKCSPLNISTKTKIAYLNFPIDLKNVFWKIPVINYHEPRVGVVKKQMKFNSLAPDDVDEILKKKANYEYIDDYVINQINNPEGRIKFKDIRKISIGICRKDITSYRCKRKSAFYNCFVVILRLIHNDRFKEIHVKVFNTGKMEIPGIQDALILDKVMTLLVDIIKPLIYATDDAVNVPLRYLEDRSETVMINSNFSCGYYINREKLYKLFKYKYKINSNFDPCSYPGIQCEFYHDASLVKQTGTQPTANAVASANAVATNTKVSFMIFRTGSVLIVGKCSEEILYQIYNFLCHIFESEYDEIKCAGANLVMKIKEKDRVRKTRKKVIMGASLGGCSPTPPI